MSRGYEKTSMQDVMAATGLSKGALYHHFSGKGEILECLISQEQERVVERLAQLAGDRTLTAADKVGAFIDRMLDSESMSMLTSQRWAEKAPFALLSALRTTTGRLSDLMASIIRDGVESGELSCPCPQEVAQVLMILIDVWLDPLIAPADERALGARMDFIVDLLDKYEAPVIGPEKVRAVTASVVGRHA